MDLRTRASDARAWVDRDDVVVATGRIDFARSRFVGRDGRVQVLTTREAELLACLAASDGKPVSREHLLTAVWGHHELSLSRAVDATVARVRKKLEPDGPTSEVLFTEHGSGYRLLVAQPRAATPDAPTMPRRLLRLGSRMADLAAGHVDGPEGRTSLTTRERLVLEQLARTPHTFVEGDALARKAGVVGGKQALANAIYRLRTKLEDDPSEPRWLVTVRGTGYRLDAAVEEPKVARTVQRAALGSLTDHVGLLLGFSDFVVYARVGDAFVQVAAFGIKRAPDGGVVAPLTQKMGEGIVGHAAMLVQPVLVPDVTLDKRYLRDLMPARSELAVPVRSGDAVIGVLDTESVHVAAYGDQHLTALLSLAAIAALALAQEGN